MYADKRGLEKPSLVTTVAGVAGTAALLPSHLTTHLAPTPPPTHALQQQHHQLQLQQQHQQLQLQHQQQQQQHHQHVSALHTHHNLQQHMQQQQQQQQQHEATTLSQQQHLQQQQQHQQQQQASQQTAQQQQQQQAAGMFTRFDANKSTKGASKMRRDLINAEIANLRDLLPLPQSTRQRLSQLQLMALVCVYVRKANYFQQVFKRHNALHHQTATPNIGFSKALSGFLMMLTQNGKLLYISDNAAEYLGHSMEDLLIHGDSVYDIIDKQDHATIQAELNRNVPPQPGGNGNISNVGNIGNIGQSESTASNGGATSLEGEHRMFLCRMNVSRNARRQMRFGDQKVVLVQGHYLSFLPLCSRNEPVFLATCTPIAMPETRECVVQGATNVFTTIHSMDMKIAHIDKNGEFHLGYDKTTLQGTSWYNLIHSENLREAQSKHRLITQSEQDRSCILLVRMQRGSGDYAWVHVVLQVRDSPDSTQQPVIVCTNQVLNEREAAIMVANAWLYHYYTVQSKIQFGMPLDSAMRVPPSSAANVAYYAATQQPHHMTPGQPPHSGGGAASGGSGAMFAGHHHHHSHHAAYHHHHHHHMGAYGGVYHAETAAGGLGSATAELKEQQSQPQYNFHPAGVEPVDYSQVHGGASQKSSQRLSPPPKKRARNKLEPLYLQAAQRSPAGQLTTTPEPDCTHYALHAAAAYASGAGGGAPSSSDAHASVIYATIVPTRSRLLNKTLPPDPADFIEQWNPSPPWSESAQKASLDSFSSSHELSPCITTTPPTPTSAPHHSAPQTIGPAFSFEWMSDPLVPVVDACLTCVPPEGIPIVMSTQQQWPTPVGDHHQHLSQHLAAAQHQQQRLALSGGLALHNGHAAALEHAIEATDATEPVEDRDPKN